VEPRDIPQTADFPGGRHLVNVAEWWECRDCGRHFMPAPSAAASPVAQEGAPTEDAETKRITALGFRRAEVVDGRLEVQLTLSQEMALIIAGNMMELLDSHGAENYVEMQLRVPDKPEMVTLTVQRWMGKTPHQARQDAEREVGVLTARIAESERQREALAEAVRVVENRTGCGDHSCLFRKPTGMGTNGGCRCPRRPGLSEAFALLYRAALAALPPTPETR
jgi:hypothetical protein